MTRCIRNEVNLKSTAYNQTGQNYFEQLAAYNSMSQHLRRILLAKSVVDTRNKNYMCRKNKRSKPADDRRICSLPETTDDIIDRLAYDTQHHPMDVLRIKPSLECLDYCDCNLEHRRSRNCGRLCCRASSQNRRQRSRSQRSISPATASKRKKFISNAVYGMEFKTARRNPCMIGSSVGFLRQRKCRYETDPVFVPCTTATLDSLEFKPTCCSPIQETNDHRSASSSTSRSHDDSDRDKAVNRPVSQQEDGKKYVNFIYDITREIKQNGLYTDKELQDVFKKHIEKNKGTLDMNRMLYEVYQLKISLNILDDGSDTDDELEDLIHAQTLLHVSEIRPPTPPKVLDENKVIDKLQSYQKSIETQNGQLSKGPTKKVVLYDFNEPKMYPITVKDLMVGVIEMQMHAQEVRANSSVSKHVSTQDETEEKLNGQKESDVHMIQSEAEASYSSQFEKSEESQDDDRRASLTGETIESSHASVKDRSIDSSVKQDANSSTSNLVSIQDETMETEELTESAPAAESSQVES
ncbi:uncharacterized protein LOC116845328 isoform X2 [Odontomachus brunneus]|uniref:uncharacterized protein LOC116845328 isoform X2 n=1 Tax=Odontomachus brunneus TaxID=486640 RepID=UPI0013F260E5|nr:uncharacterized protein LOC116845328 isoform X2 [Odontomachus brunneus]